MTRHESAQSIHAAVAAPRDVVAPRGVRGRLQPRAFAAAEAAAAVGVEPERAVGQLGGGRLGLFAAFAGVCGGVRGGDRRQVSLADERA